MQFIEKVATTFGLLEFPCIVKTLADLKKPIFYRKWAKFKNRQLNFAKTLKNGKM